MMPPQLSRTRIDRALRREEHVLPARLARRIRKLSRQRVRQPDFTETFRHVGRMLQAGALDGRLQRLAQAQRQGHAPVLSALPVAHHDLAASEVDRSEEPTSELQSLMRTPYAVLCLNKKIQTKKKTYK